MMHFAIFLLAVAWIYKHITALHSNERELDVDERKLLPKDKLFYTALLSKIVYRSPDQIKILKQRNWDAEKKSPLPTNEYELLSTVFEDQYDQKVFPVFIEDKKTDAQMYVWLSKLTKTLVLAYRGTSSGKDKVTDAKLILVKLFDNNPDVRVHSGFREQFTSIQDEIERICRKYEGQYDKIIHTGHSLGAGLATLSSVVFSEIFPNLDHECYTFGSPRPGNRAFQSLYGKRFKFRENSYRVINHHDAVTMAPMNPFYQHVHDAVQFGDAGEVEQSSEMSGIRRIMQHLLHIRKDSIEDHLMPAYLSNIYRGLFNEANMKKD